RLAPRLAVPGDGRRAALAGPGSAIPRDAPATQCRGQDLSQECRDALSAGMAWLEKLSARGIGGGHRMRPRMFVRNRSLSLVRAVAAAFATAAVGLSSMALGAQRGLALTPPMVWNDWAHYQCDFTANTILANARALVRTGLAARGYDTVTIDDCWMLKDRDSHGNLQPDPRRFPRGMRPVAAAVHALGLRFGIYEDAGAATCGRVAGSGSPSGGGKPYFRADARLFAAWGVDYLKLDGCNVHPDRGAAGSAAYRAAYRAEHIALERAGRPIVLSESAPAYFQGTADWYDVLGWVRGYGQLWREGTDIEVYDPKQPNRSRFGSVLWNYDYNLQLGRFQKPGNWNDAD